MKNTDVLTQSVIVIGMGAGLLGYRKSKDANAIETTDPIKENEKIEDPIL